MHGRMSYSAERTGAKYWHAGPDSGGRSLNISTASLGDFLKGVLLCHGEVVSIGRGTHNIQGAWCWAVVAMTDEQKDEFERTTKFRLRKPPEIQLNESLTHE